MADLRTSKERVISLLRDFGGTRSKNVRDQEALFEMIEGEQDEMAVISQPSTSATLDSDDPSKIAKAQEKMEAMRVTRGMGLTIVKDIAAKLKKITPIGDSFGGKLKHALAVQRAVEGVNLYDALTRYCQSIGIEKPSLLGIYEASKKKQTE